MKIKFQSLIDQMGNANKIEFESPVTISKWEDFDVYEFVEPANNIMNRIEVGEGKINIFAGPSSIFLELNREVKIDFQTNQGIIVFKTFMSFLMNKKNFIEFEYSIKSRSDEIVGNYKIKLEIID